MIRPSSILDATPKLKLDPKVENWMASGVVDQILTTNKNAK